MTASSDTIVAVATPPGRGGIGVVRISGPAARPIAEAVLGEVPPPRQARLGDFRDAAGAALDTGIALFFPAPHSFTGEDVLELQGHGGPVVLDLLVRRCSELGARVARPGEFSQRAFLNDKLDLAQAEAIADLIESGTEQAARAALRSLEGAFSREVQALEEQLIQLRTYIEAAIDFPDEEVDFLSHRQVGERFAALFTAFDRLQDTARQGCLLHEGMHLVIAGRPNAGKSSLLNALAGRESAIVTDVPGTTRDVLRERIQIEGMPVHVTDTAGLRETEDRVERMGVDRAWAQITGADRVLLVVDDQVGLDAEDRAILERVPAAVGVTVVRNKIDLTGRSAGLSPASNPPEVALSAKTGAGTDVLRAHLKELVGFAGPGQGEFLARRRHLEALSAARAAVEAAAAALQTQGAGELAAEDLRQAHRHLGEITGEFTGEDLLGRIFASFCIGK